MKKKREREKQETEPITIPCFRHLSEDEKKRKLAQRKKEKKASFCDVDGPASRIFSLPCNLPCQNILSCVSKKKAKRAVLKR